MRSHQPLPTLPRTDTMLWGAYYLIPKKLQVAARWEHLNPGQKRFDGISSITGGLNYYIRGDDLKLMLNYIHTWSDFREANPEFGEDQFDEVIGRFQLMFLSASFEWTRRR